MTTKQETFSIGDTEKMTGVSQKQLRHWETRGYIPAPTRVICGQRAYRHFTKKQVEQVQAIKSLLDQGFTLAHATQAVRNPKKEGN